MSFRFNRNISTMLRKYGYMLPVIQKVFSINWSNKEWNLIRRECLRRLCIFPAASHVLSKWRCYIFPPGTGKMGFNCSNCFTEDRVPVGTRYAILLSRYVCTYEAKNQRQINYLLSVQKRWKLQIFTTCRWHSLHIRYKYSAKNVWENENDHGPKSFSRYLQH